MIEYIKQLGRQLNIFAGPSYNDHQGKPSMGRKWLAVLIFALIAFVFAGLWVSTSLDPKTGGMVLGFYQAGLTALATAVTALGAWVYGSKAHHQANEAKANAAASITPAATTPATTSPPAQTTAPPAGATAKTTTATDTSTKAADKPQGAS